jgi:hypothetical protein
MKLSAFSAAPRHLRSLRLPRLAGLTLYFDSPMLLRRGAGLALCVRPGVRASASAALTQALLQGVQRLGLIRAAQPAASEGSEGSPKRSAGSRMHERVAHARGDSAKERSLNERVAHACGASDKNDERMAPASSASRKYDAKQARERS